MSARMTMAGNIDVQTRGCRFGSGIAQGSMSRDHEPLRAGV